VGEGYGAGEREDWVRDLIAIVSAMRELKNNSVVGVEEIAVESHLGLQLMHCIDLL